MFGSSGIIKLNKAVTFHSLIYSKNSQTDTANISFNFNILNLYIWVLCVQYNHYLLLYVKLSSVINVVDVFL